MAPPDEAPQSDGELQQQAHLRWLICTPFAKTFMAFMGTAGISTGLQSSFRCWLHKQRAAAGCLNHLCGVYMNEGFAHLPAVPHTC